jgi:ABC-type nickel/cobalt efflux system permease component RcnA
MSLAVLVALLVGAMHALAPGHGKSLVAFALAGRQERAGRAAVTVGATVTATHTASVLVLGFLVAGATSVVPEAVFSVISVATGAIVLVLGLALLRNAVRRPGHGRLRSHSHGHPHPHSHGGPDHAHPHSHAHPHEARSRSTVAVAVEEHTHGDIDQLTELPTARRGVLVTLGITGGLLPSPSAVVVLLAAAAAGRAWYGVLLVLAFGVGMALTLAGVGFAVLRGQERLLAIAERSPKPWMNRVLQQLPVVTASAVVLVGIALVITALG